MNTTYIGVVDGLHTWQVRDEGGTVIGCNQSAWPPCPGEGWVLDEMNGVWVEQENSNGNV